MLWYGCCTDIIHCQEIVRAQDNGSATNHKRHFAASLPTHQLPSNASRIVERITGVREAFGGFQDAWNIAATTMVLLAKLSVRKLNHIPRQVRKTDF
jgi:hypothetical protein